MKPEEAAQPAADAAATDPFIFLFTVFVLAIFVGYYVVWNVTPALHSPLMSVHQRDFLRDHRRRADRRGPPPSSTSPR